MTGKIEHPVDERDGGEEIPSMQLLDRVLAETATELLSSTVYNVVDRRVKWTIYQNLNAWFIN